MEFLHLVLEVFLDLQGNSSQLFRLVLLSEPTGLVVHFELDGELDDGGETSYSFGFRGHFGLMHLLASH